MTALNQTIAAKISGVVECQPGFGNSYFGISEFGDTGWPGFGVSEYGRKIYGESHYFPLIFQRRRSEKVDRSWRILAYDFVISRTDLQQDNRIKFKAGLGVWAAFSSSEKEVYRVAAKGRPLFGISLFLREWMLA
jgi:hypothetical protein